MSEGTNIEIVKGILIPLALYLVKKGIDWVGKILGNQRAERKYRFDKISSDKKVDVLSKIDGLKEKPLTPHIIVQIKLLYEQIGIYLPVWHCHQLISCMASENISSLDIRLGCFLKNTIIGKYSDDDFSVDDKEVSKSYGVVILFGVVSLLVFIYAGVTTVYSLWKQQEIGLFMGFLLAYFLLVFIVFIKLVSQVEDIWQAVRFGRLFDDWLHRSIQSDNIDTSNEITSDPPA
ncbi:hypothetical protein EDC48_108145 [Gibbsiella quercinecans]|uniref:Uncharacterized protein n=1 Tax=Gibbsiella quercinecans TaxID=929813 RepID=A0A250B567_9GAMM|nr:hypothetical protein [Gibbsiella quercinecans]ATA21319.1 hypothetical protein AWC35_19360 [Gibbsiella quercinecans]RLM09793.1 hypothetical protein BIY31_09145 [Gibbsiella quercinecans]RLM13490.1 hypothetical protein BIY30_05180 [Gibbsiella quercinecans]TCT88563.1 hypothetical protein EDC48_108145 [Gibbsiella quercinecans]